MSIAWLAPPLILLVGLALSGLLARSISVLVQDVDRARRRARQTEQALIPLRVETRRARQTLDRYDAR